MSLPFSASAPPANGSEYSIADTEPGSQDRDWDKYELVVLDPSKYSVTLVKENPVLMLTEAVPVGGAHSVEGTFVTQQMDDYYKSQGMQLKRGDFLGVYRQVGSRRTACTVLLHVPGSCHVSPHRILSCGA